MGNPSAWFRSAHQLPPGTPRVYCFPHAGGNSRMFLQWRSRVDACDIVAVTMPGRGHRFDEPAPTSIDAYADGAAEAIARTGDDVPYQLFGHSLGALVAFEVARRLRDDPRLRRLVASGAAAPTLMPSPRVVHAAGLQGKAFAEAIGAFGGLPPEFVAAEELHDLLLPSVQADFRLVAGYRYHPAEPLPVEVTLVNGRDDAHVTPERIDGWAAETRLPVRRHWVPGGHFYLQDAPQAVVDILDAIGDAAGPGHTELLI